MCTVIRHGKVCISFTLTPFSVSVQPNLSLDLTLIYTIVHPATQDKLGSGALGAGIGPFEM